MRQKRIPLNLSLNLCARTNLAIDNQQRFNGGYFFLQDIYYELGLEKIKRNFIGKRAQQQDLLSGKLKREKEGGCNVCYISGFNPNWNPHCRPCEFDLSDLRWKKIATTTANNDGCIWGHNIVIWGAEPLQWFSFFYVLYNKREI